MPNAFIYLAIMLMVICIWFMLLKRPIYESIFVAFVVLVLITNKWANVWEYVQEGLGTSLIHSMTAFVAMSLILTKTKIIDGAVAIILSLLGRVAGGAGYVAVVASAFMGALSGSGAGNVMATGVITIPAMKKSGFPAELAANVESASSYLGNMIPPSSNVVAALAAFVAIYPTRELTTSQFWIVCWGCSAWFVFHRLMMVFVFCKVYKVKAMAKEDVPSLRETVRNGWQGLLLPIVILLPFLLDNFLKATFFTERLGEVGAKYMSSSLLYFIPGIATVYAIVVARDKKAVMPKAMAKTFSKGIKSISPAISACIFGYMIGSLFVDLNVSADLEHFISVLNVGRIGLAFIVPLFTCFMGMLIPGSSVVTIFGPLIISLFATVGANPILVAAMLPCICGVMCGITPPLALGMYAGMSIAESDFSKTVKNNLWWVFTQYALEVIVLLGWLPILGL